MNNDVVFVKIGKAIDWFELDQSESSKEYLDNVVTPFLDLVVEARGNNALGKKRFSFLDRNGKSYSETIRNLVSGDAIKVYYADSDAQPNLTPFIPDRAIGMAESLFSEIAEFIFDRQQRNQQAIAGE